VALDTKDPEEIISIVKAIAPAYGGINLEDIAAPKCFDIEARLREELDIPVFHDDQHGTAIVVLSALINALKIVNKKIEDVRIVVSGVGAARARRAPRPRCRAGRRGRRECRARRADAPRSRSSAARKCPPG